MCGRRRWNGDGGLIGSIEGCNDDFSLAASGGKEVFGYVMGIELECGDGARVSFNGGEEGLGLGL